MTLMKTDQGEEKTDISIQESRLAQVDDPSLQADGTEEGRQDHTIANMIVSGTNVGLGRRKIMMIFDRFLQTVSVSHHLSGQSYLYNIP